MDTINGLPRQYVLQTLIKDGLFNPEKALASLNNLDPQLAIRMLASEIYRQKSNVIACRKAAKRILNARVDEKVATVECHNIVTIANASDYGTEEYR